MLLNLVRLWKRLVLFYIIFGWLKVRVKIIFNKLNEQKCLKGKNNIKQNLMKKILRDFNLSK